MTSLAVTTAAVFVAFTMVIGALVSLAARFMRRAAWARASTPWALSIVLPLVVGFIGCVALVLPTSLTGCHCLTHAHHPHVCLAHAALARAAHALRVGVARGLVRARRAAVIV